MYIFVLGRNVPTGLSEYDTIYQEASSEVG